VTTASYVTPTDLLVDSIRATQQTFRTVLDALSRPGTIRQLTAPPTFDPTGTPGNPWTIAVLLMMVDHEVSLAVEPAEGAEALAAFVRRRTRADVASSDAADVVVVDAAALDPGLPAAIRRGSLQYPDDSATLIVQLPTLDQHAPGGPRLVLVGPGIDGERELRLPGIPAAFFEARAEAVSRYPMGIDLVFVDDAGRVVGLPRSTRVTIVEVRVA
jgi:alpha-D-ribose 1-methylphosphonate 5-triphosphate synthase subunit PhnH